jgi:hypothetical protein
MSRINNILTKFGWKTRRWDYKFELFTMNLGLNEEWGFRFINLQHQFKDYSLISYFISLPSHTTKQHAVVEEWDILWLRNILWSRYNNLTNNFRWEQRQPSRTEAIELWILERIFI